MAWTSNKLHAAGAADAGADAEGAGGARDTRSSRRTAGGGMVTVKATGTGEIPEIKIEKEAIDPDDPETARGPGRRGRRTTRSRRRRSWRSRS